MAKEDQAPKATYFPEIPGKEELNTINEPRISGEDILPGSIPWDRIGLGPFDITNQIIPGTTAGDASIIRTGGANTDGLYIKGDDTVVSTGSVLVDTQSSGSGSSNYPVTGGGSPYFAVSFACSITGILDSVVLKLRNSNASPGNITVTVRAHSGTYGNIASEPGAILATAPVLNVLSLTTTATDYTFTFVGANRIALTPGTKYFIVVNYPGANIVRVTYVGANPHAGVSGQSVSGTSGTWTMSTINDAYFIVNSDGATLPYAGVLQEWQNTNGTALSYVDFAGNITAPKFVSTVAIGTQPYAATSTTLNTNLNADLLDSQHGAYYLDSDNFTGTEWTDLTDAGATTLHKHDHGGMDGLSDNDHPQYAIRTFTWVIQNPAVGGIPGPRMGEALTVTRIDSYVTAATSVAFNIEERNTIAVAGTDILTSDQTADVDGASDTSFANSSLDVGDWLWLDISAVTGTPGYVVITLIGTLT